MAERAAEVLEASPCKKDFEPLLVGLQLFMGKEVIAAPEVMEVARDVAKRVEKRRDGIQALAKLGLPPVRLILIESFRLRNDAKRLAFKVQRSRVQQYERGKATVTPAAEYKPL